MTSEERRLCYVGIAARKRLWMTKYTEPNGGKMMEREHLAFEELPEGERDSVNRNSRQRMIAESKADEFLQNAPSLGWMKRNVEITVRIY